MVDFFKSSIFAFVQPLLAMMSYCTSVLPSTSEYAVINAYRLPDVGSVTPPTWMRNLFLNNVGLKDSWISCPAVIAHEHAMIAQADNC